MKLLHEIDWGLLSICLASVLGAVFACIGILASIAYLAGRVC